MIAPPSPRLVSRRPGISISGLRAVAEQMRRLQRRGIAYTLTPGVPAFAAAAAMLGRELTLPEVSQSVVPTRVGGRASAMPAGEDLAAFTRMREAITGKRKAVFILGMNGSALMVAGSHTGAADMFALAGVTNALAAMDGYKPAGDEATLAAAPEALVLMSERTGGLTDDALRTLVLLVLDAGARIRLALTT